jgi:hypothetical protein
MNSDVINYLQNRVDEQTMRHIHALATDVIAPATMLTFKELLCMITYQIMCSDDALVLLSKLKTSIEHMLPLSHSLQMLMLIKPVGDKFLNSGILLQTFNPIEQQLL